MSETRRHPAIPSKGPRAEAFATRAAGMPNLASKRPNVSGGPARLSRRLAVLIAKLAPAANCGLRAHRRKADLEAYRAFERRRDDDNRNANHNIRTRRSIAPDPFDGLAVTGSRRSVNMAVAFWYWPL